jgi:transcriptional regulator with XRE-family HTH domain
VLEPKIIVGRNIRRRRKKLDLTQEAAAERCSVHPVEFARAERGKRDMRVSTVAKIAKGLDISASELMAGIGGRD